MEKVKNGDTLKVHYTGRLEDGKVFDSSLSEGREPLEVTLGQGMLIPGFESGLIGMSLGDKKTIEIEPDQAYGERRDDMTNEVPRSYVPEGVKVDDMLTGQSAQGPINVRVAEVKEETVVLDANHPLAGKKLIFDLEVVEHN
jgi:FKBP-type peptidyl-prolyl cis-trans isomerase 2